MSAALFRQAVAYGARLRDSKGGSRRSLETALRKGTDDASRTYNDGVREGWESRDTELRQLRAIKSWRG